MASSRALAGTNSVEITIGVSSDGLMTSEWARAIEERNSKGDVERLMNEKVPLSTADLVWIEVIKGQIATWKQSMPGLAVPFPNTPVPEKIRVLIGNRGGDDGFTYGESTIAMDVRALAKNYGEASTRENRERINRLLDHEYTHLLHKLWLSQNQVKLETPLDRALWECLYEGLGNYRSLSSKWVSPDGVISATGSATLDELAPIFVERMERLSKANTSEEKTLSAGLSSGPFHKKWGALPVALWLAKEARGDDAQLAKWVDQGPQAVLTLAKRNLPASYLPRLERLTALQAGAQQSDIKLVNLGLNFRKYWTEIRHQKIGSADIEAHLRLFKKHVVMNQTQFYLDVVFDKRPPGKEFDVLLREALADSIPVFEKYENQIASNIDSFEAKARVQIQRLQSEIPGFRADIPIYGMASLDKFAGGVRLHDGKQILVISVDKLAAIDRDFEMVFTHEVFHVYHNQKNPTLRADLSRSADLIVAGMFIEGIATFAEGHLNPKQKSRRMVKELVEWCDNGHYRRYIPELLSDNAKLAALNFEANKHLYRKWFYTARDQAYPFPTEAAYCIGDRVVSELATQHSMQTMVSWNVPKLIMESKRVLDQWIR